MSRTALQSWQMPGWVTLGDETLAALEHAFVSSAIQQGTRREEGARRWMGGGGLGLVLTGPG